MIKKLFYILGKKATRQVIVLFLFMVIASVLEAFSIGLILPFIDLINHAGDVKSKYYLDNLYALIAPSNHERFLIILAVGLLCVYLFKGLFLLVLTLFQSKFIYNQQADISNNLLHSYLYSPYTFHLQRNTPELLRNLTISMGAIFGSGIIPFMVIMAEVPVILSIAILLFAVQPIVTAIAVVVVGGLTAIFYKFVRTKIGYYGGRVQDTGTRMILWASQSMAGIKEIKILGKESYFLDHFAKYRIENSKVNVYFTVVQKIPRLYLEVILMGGMLLIMTVIILQRGNLREFMPIIGLFAMASIRILPSVNQIISSMTAMKFGAAAVDDIYGDIKYFREHTIDVKKPTREKDFDISGSIEAKGLSFTYPGSEMPVFKNVTFNINRGCSIAFVGPSGSGKTTLANILLGLLPPSAGDLIINGKNIFQTERFMSSWQHNIGYVPQDTYLINDSLKRNIALGVDDTDINPERIWEVIRHANLEETVRQLPQGLDTNVGEQGIRLSGGQKQRVSIARALYHDPSVIIMDEATSSLDNETESEISRAIEKLRGNKTVIIIAHRLSTIKSCDCLFFLKDGTLIDSGTYEVLIARNADFRIMVQHPEAGLIVN